MPGGVGGARASLAPTRFCERRGARLPPATHLVILVKGTAEQARALLLELVGVVEAIGLQLKPEKTGVTHIDMGFVFLGQRIVRRAKGPKRYVYTLVCDEALTSVKRKVKALTGRSTIHLELSELLRALNPILRVGRPTSATPRQNAPSPTSGTTPGGG
jgi:hypothetical protein